MTVLLFASVVVVVTWPFYKRILARTKGRTALSAVLTTVLLGLVVFVPTAIVVYLFVQQGIDVAQLGIEYVKGPKFAKLVADVIALPQSDRLPPWLDRFIPEDFDVQEAISGPLQKGVLAVLGAGQAFLPDLLQGTVNAGIDAVIFVFAVLTMYMEGPRISR